MANLNVAILSVQVYIYYLCFPADKWHTKALVYAVYIIEIVQTVIVTEDSYNAYASGFGNVSVLESMQLE